jgi:effector-binding domain-containing protein
MSYEVNLREEKAIKAMTRRFNTNMRAISVDAVIGQVFSDIWEHIQKNGGRPTGKFFALYHDDEFDAYNIDVEVGISVEELVADGGGVAGRIVEGGTHAVVLYKGPYDGIEAAYDALGKWVGENGCSVAVPKRESYLNDPASVAPEELLTEVLWPVRK